MNGNDKCYKCTKRKIGCHDRCPDYTPKDYSKYSSEWIYDDYLTQAKSRMKKERNLFRRGIRSET